MKLNIKKVATVLGSALMLGATAGMAAAASFTPSSFGDGGVAIVVGANAANSDLKAAVDLTSNLAGDLAAQTAIAASTVSGGDAIGLASGSDFLYLNDELNENVATITKDDLSAVLADGTFTDDDGTDYKYEQIITVGSGATFAFGNSDNDLDDPALMLALPTSTNPIYTLTTTFDDPVNFSATASEGESISLFGKSYTVGTATDADTLVLLGGSDAEKIEVGETKTLVVNGESYEVILNGISSATTAQASISVNGVTKTFTEGQTKEIVDGVDLFAKTVFRTGDNMGHVELEIGADKLTFENGNSVKTGSDNTEIEGTTVTLTGAATATTVLSVAVYAQDNDANHVLAGESFVDPVFGTVKVNFAGVNNGPTIVSMEDTSSVRTKLSIDKGGNRELLITATDAAGKTQSFPFTYQNATSSDNSETFHIVEGTTMSDEDYFILNSGNYQHLMQLTKVDCDSSGYVTMKDVFTGDSYSTTDAHNWTADSTDTLTISGQTYTVTRISDTTATVTTSDYSKTSGIISVYPYIELVSGEDHRFAITDNVTITGVTNATTLRLPTGDITLSGVNATTISSETAGSVDYVITSTTNGTATYADVTIALDVDQDASNDNAWTAPALLFVEDEDKSEATTTTKNAVILRTTDSGTYSTVLAPVFTGTSDTESFDDSDFTGYITNFGTYVLFDSDDTNQDFASLTYSKTPMYADVFVAEEAATITGGSSGSVSSLGSVTVYDNEVSSVSGKNLIVIGGSCINSVAAELLGGAACDAEFTAKTGIKAGEALIKSFTRGTKVALLVAGFNAADTTKAVTYLSNKPIDTTVGKALKVTSATEATAITA